MKQDSLWIRWIDAVYLKGMDLWDYQLPSSSNLHWRTIIKERNYFARAYHNGVWTHSASNAYTILEGYAWLTSVNRPFLLASAIWNRVIMPKHNFILWLVVQNRLLMKDRLMGWNITVDNTYCLLFEIEEETNAHLFFRFAYSI